MKQELFLQELKLSQLEIGKVNLKDTYVNIKNGEIFIYGMHIAPYEFGNIFNKDPLRTRKLLLHKKEILKLYGMIKEKGVSLVPITLYFEGNKVKLEVGIGKGKRWFDKRQDMAKKESERKIDRALKGMF